MQKIHGLFQWPHFDHGYLDVCIYVYMYVKENPILGFVYAIKYGNA